MDTVWVLQGLDEEAEDRTIVPTLLDNQGPEITLGCSEKDPLLNYRRGPKAQKVLHAGTGCSLLGQQSNSIIVRFKVDKQFPGPKCLNVRHVVHVPRASQ